jgi:hypothetical protein
VRDGERDDKRDGKENNDDCSAEVVVRYFAKQKPRSHEHSHVHVLVLVLFVLFSAVQ